MTVSRYLILLVCVLSPVSASGQLMVRPQAGPDSSTNGQFAQDSGSMLSVGAESQSGGPEAGSVGASGLPFGGNSQPQSAGMGPTSDFPHGLMPSAGRHYSTPIFQTTDRGGYFGVMGAISKPGVYFHAQERVLLGDIVKLAGGATSEASGGVRIVRQGRGGLQTFLSPESRYELLNGDVILLETIRRPGQPGLRQYSGTMQTSNNGMNRQSSTDKTAKKGTTTSYLAFVNLEDQPIVVPVPSDEATLSTVMTWLRQDLRSPPFVRVIAPSPLLRRDNSLPPELQVLESGTVLVFDPATVNRSRLPEFPPVIGSAAATPDEPVVKVPAPINLDETSVRPPTPSPQLQVPQPQIERPAGRATRSPLPIAAPPPPSDSPVRIIPRRDSSQAMPVPTGTRWSQGGPALLLPQNSGQPDSGTPRPAAPEELSRDGDRKPGATAASYQNEPLSWSSQRPDGAAQALDLGLTDAEILQMHGEQGRVDGEIQIGPGLELPRPVPELVPVHAEPPVKSSPTQAPSAQSLTADFSTRIVLFGVGGMIFLVVTLWCLSRWDGPRPVHARVAAGRVLANRRDSSVLSKSRTVLVAEAQSIRRADIGPNMNDKPSSASPTPPPATEPALPLPLRSISQQEHALRAHFRQAWQERGQHPVADNAADEIEDEVVLPPLAAVAPSVPPVLAAGSKTAISPPSAVPAPHVKKSDILDRVLAAKRGNTAAE